ncbi:hypothetical protein SK128_006864, partial [Halocaridina rubra]
DQRTLRHSEGEHSPDDTYSISSTTTLMKDQDSLNMVPIEEDKPSSPDKDDREVVASSSGERRLSKGPAPPPPVSVSPASTPSSSASSTPSKKGPAPAVPSVSAAPVKGAADTAEVPQPDSAPSKQAATPTAMDVKSPQPITIQSKQVASTPSGKGPAPKPVIIEESPIAKERVVAVISPIDIPNENKSLSKEVHVSDILPETDNTTKVDVVRPFIDEPKNDDVSRDSKSTISEDVLLPYEEGRPSLAQYPSDLTSSQMTEDAEPLTPPPPFKDSTPTPPIDEPVDDALMMEAEESVLSSKEVDENMFSLPSPPTSLPSSPTSSSASELALADVAHSQMTSPPDKIISRSSSSEDAAHQPSQLSAPVSLTPEPSETIIASIGSDATVIVRTPTPTPPDAPKSDVPLKKESVVTYSGPAIVDENGKDESENLLSAEGIVESTSRVSPAPSPSLSEAEEQAVRILESAIESAVETASNKSTHEDMEDINVTLSGTSVILSPDDKEKDETDSQVVDQDSVPADKDVLEVQVLPNDGHKLDESEVVITSSSILHDENEPPQMEASSKSRYEITLEEIGEAEDAPSSQTSDSDTTHISVVAVDDLGDSPNKQPTSAPASGAVSPVSPDKKPKSPIHNEIDHEGHHETSSNISNMSNLSAGTNSTGRSVSSAEEENRHMALTIEGTTVGATDVDDDVFDQEHNNIKNLKESQPRRPVLTRESTVSSVVSVESTTRPILTRESTFDSVMSADSVISTVSTVSTPQHSNIAQRRSGNATKVVPNGIGKDSHGRLSEKSDWDNISTTSSEKENKPRSDHDDNSEEVVLRRSPMSDKNDLSLRPSDRNRDGRARTKEEMEIVAHRKKTRKRTRKFVIDGVVVTTTTSKVIYGDDEEMETMSSGHLARKQELRELKLLQKIEQKQFQELAVKANFAKAEQEKKFDIEKIQLLRSYDTEVESLNRQQKQQVEKAEAQQEIEVKNASKKIRSEQERELKAFRESLKTELKLLKQEIDLLPKDKRKEAFKIRKERLDVDQTEREKIFLEKLHEAHEVSLKRLGDDHRERIALLERQFLQQKHQLLRSRESALWEMEERHLHEKHQLAKRQLKDIFFLQRHQMLVRHEKELEQVKRVNQQKEEDLVKRQHIERRQLPKRIRQEMKARELMFRESMRISTSHLPDSQEDEKDKLKKFQENEKRRYEAEKRRAEQKHRHKLEELQAASEATIKELEQLQNEKRKMLMEHETYKLKSQDEEYQREVREWKDNLKPRKQ